jgi:hypothetical protein
MTKGSARYQVTDMGPLVFSFLGKEPGISATAAVLYNQDLIFLIWVLVLQQDGFAAHGHSGAVGDWR